MRALFLFLALLLGTALVGQPLNAQTGQTDPGITATRVIGEIKGIDAAAKQLTVKTDAGSIVTVVLSDVTTYSRLAPGETTMDKATPITLVDLGEGDLSRWCLGKVSHVLCPGEFCNWGILQIDNLRPKLQISVHLPNC